MYPYVNVFGRELSTYALMTLAGVLIAGFFVCRTASKRGHDDNDYIKFLLVCSVGVLLGGHILYAITMWQSIAEFFSHLDIYAANINELISSLAYIFGGAVFYGGLLGGIAAGAIYARIKKLDLREYSDICAPMIPLFHGFGRIGCFLGGCCFGIECDFGFTAHGNELIPMLNDVSRFPVQLLEALLNFILFFVLWHLLRRGKFKGKLIFIYLISYSVIRFFDEFLRGDSYRGIWFGLSTSQIISIIIFMAAAVILTAKKIKEKKSGDILSPEASAVE